MQGLHLRWKPGRQDRAEPSKRLPLPNCDACTALPPLCSIAPFLLSTPIFAILTDNHHSQKHSPVCCCNNTTGQRGTLYLPLWGQVFKLKTSINLREQNMIAPSEFWSTSPNIIQRPSFHSLIMPNAPKINYPLSALPPESNLAFDGATSTEQIFKESRSLCDHCQWAACQLCNIIKHVYARCQRRSCGRRHEFIGIGGIWYMYKIKIVLCMLKQCVYLELRKNWTWKIQVK